MFPAAQIVTMSAPRTSSSCPFGHLLRCARLDCVAWLSPSTSPADAIDSPAASSSRRQESRCRPLALPRSLCSGGPRAHPRRRSSHHRGVRHCSPRQVGLATIDTEVSKVRAPIRGHFGRRYRRPRRISQHDRTGCPLARRQSSGRACRFEPSAAWLADSFFDAAGDEPPKSRQVLPARLPPRSFPLAPKRRSESPSASTSPTQQ